MPAFASFSRTYLTESKFLISLRSRLASRFNSSGSKTKLLPKTVCFARLKSRWPANASSRSFSRLYDGDYAESNVVTNTYQAAVPRVHTEIIAVPHRDFEEVIGMKSLSVDQFTQ